jgi:hypothetical protein
LNVAIFVKFDGFMCNEFIMKITPNTTSEVWRINVLDNDEDGEFENGKYGWRHSKAISAILFKEG